MLIIDIETYRNLNRPDFLKYKLGDVSAPSNYKDPEKIAQYKAEQSAKLLGKAALSPLTGKIILIGMKKDDEPFNYLGLSSTSHGINNPDEKAMLQIFWDILFNNADIIYTYNGKEFDFPFIFARSLLLDVKPTISWNELTNKYNNRVHVDLSHLLGEGKLQEWSYLLGETNTLASEGNMVDEWYGVGNYQAIIDHCHADILNTYAIAKRIAEWVK